MEPVDLECWYCGHKWSEYPRWNSSGYRCPKCDDKQIFVRKREQKIDTYAGSSPFPKSDDGDNGDWGR